MTSNEVETPCMEDCVRATLGFPRGVSSLLGTIRKHADHLAALSQEFGEVSNG